MAASPQKRRQKGSMTGLIKGLWSMYQRHVEFVEDPASDHETCVKSANAAVQIALAYCRATELFEVEHRMEALEHLAERNGHAA
jgi:hypothetical protein